VNAVARDGTPVLMGPVATGQVEVVRMLLQAGARLAPRGAHGGGARTRDQEAAAGRPLRAGRRLVRRWLPILAAVVSLLAAPPLQAESPKERAAKLMKTLARTRTRRSARRRRGPGRHGRLGLGARPDRRAQGSSADVRIAATYALTKLKDHAQPAVPALKEMLTDPNSLVRYNAVVALQNMDAATSDELMPALAPLLADRDKEIRENVLKMLFNVGLADRRCATRWWARGAGPGVRREVASAVERRQRGTRPARVRDAAGAAGPAGGRPQCAATSW
jgi:hypothetical protein